MNIVFIRIFSTFIIFINNIFMTFISFFLELLPNGVKVWLLSSRKSCRRFLVEPEGHSLRSPTTVCSQEKPAPAWHLWHCERRPFQFLL